MKTIITTVGTSIFSNLTKDDENEKIARKCEDLKEIRFAEWGKNSSTIEILKGLVNSAIRKQGEKASAEIDSILKIAKGEDVIIHLLATDTILSVLAAEIIKHWFDGKQTVHFTNQYERDVIQNLQVENLNDFKDGLKNLITRFYAITGEYPQSQDYILNITGGYKALIPYMTILGQITKISLNYKFEETDSLIEIPRLPIKRDYELFDTHVNTFQKIEEEVELRTSEYYQFIQDAESCLEYTQNGKMFTLNSLGLIFWEEYKKEFFSFYSPDEVWEEIQSQNDILRILKTKLYNPQVWKSSKNEKKGDKWCYDDGDNNNRIYYLFQNSSLYIYKTFESESAAKKYIDQKIDFDKIIKNSKLRKIKIENV